MVTMLALLKKTNEVRNNVLQFVLEVARKTKNYAKFDPMSLGFLVIEAPISDSSKVKGKKFYCYYF